MDTLQQSPHLVAGGLVLGALIFLLASGLIFRGSVQLG